MHKIERGGLQLSEYGLFLHDYSVPKMDGEPTYQAQRIGGPVRTLVRILWNGVWYWCDNMTGQLYDATTLTCLSQPRFVLDAEPVATGKKNKHKRAPRW